MCRGTTLGGTAINIHVYVRGSDEYHYVTEYNADHVKFNDDDGAEYVLVRRADYDNLAAIVEYVHDDIPDLDHLNNRPVYIDIDDAASSG
jgi:hypothetical protein